MKLRQVGREEGGGRCRETERIVLTKESVESSRMGGVPIEREGVNIDRRETRGRS